MGLFAVTFESLPEQGWVDTLKQTGFVLVEPLGATTLSVYGPRAALPKLRTQLSFLVDVLEIPSGVKFVVDPDDPGTTARVAIELVGAASDVILPLLASAAGRPAVPTYEREGIRGFDSELSLSDSYAFASLPEVAAIIRHVHVAGPSDERGDRLIGGTWNNWSSAARTSWPTTLAPITSPYYWDQYLSSLAGIGVNPANQTIGFFDTGIDSATACPAHLRTAGGGCQLVERTDTTSGFIDATRIANDYHYHGTLTSSIAAGLATTYSNGRDREGYALTQGVGSGARVAICKMFLVVNCDPGYYRTVNPDPNRVEPTFSANDAKERVRYGLVEMSRTDTLPDGVLGAGARIFNHSWNMQSIDYEDNAILLDQSTRLLSTATFDFGTTSANNLQRGSPLGGLHIVSAGNIGQYYLPPSPNPNWVTAPGTNKNGITVGSTENYNQLGPTLQAPQDYLSICSPGNDAADADAPHDIATDSRTGWPNLRLKPDLVAPGTRVYGRRSSSVDYCNGACVNHLRASLDPNDPYVWSYGTSFAAPAVAGAAVLIRDWLRVRGFTDASPALVKSTLIAGAQNLCTTNPCNSINGIPIRPAPDQQQGWGGVSLDRYFGAAANYYFYDQQTTFEQGSGSWTKTLTIDDTSRPVSIALVWTDAAASVTVATTTNLINDLDLRATVNGHNYYGNNYYTDIYSVSRDGYSLQDPSPVYDRKNNVEKIDVRASELPVGGGTITVTVTPAVINGDGLNPYGTLHCRCQDFALAVINAHE
jgi:hypothetical protein